MSKIRLNRIDGIVYRDLENNQLEAIAHHIDVVILWHSKKFRAEMFNMPLQDWVQVTGITPRLDLVHFVLNSGQTNALYNWETYRDYFGGKNPTLDSVITRIGFEPSDVYYDYDFQAFSAPQCIEKINHWRLQNPNAPMVDETLPPNIQVKLNREYRLSGQSHNQHVGVIF